MLVGLALVLSAIYATQPSTPRFQGKDVYDWMFANKSSDLQDNPGLMAIGTNAVPYLARALAMRNTPYDRYAWVRRPFTQRLLKSLGVDMRWTMPSRNIRRRAVFSLMAFDYEAAPALPEILDELVSPDAADPQGIYDSISRIGMPSESIPYLVKAWSLHTSSHLRMELLSYLGRGGTNAASLALPLAIEALDIPNQEIQRAAAGALNHWGVPAPNAVPKLITLISSTNIHLAVSCAAALGRITNRADIAISAIRKLHQKYFSHDVEAVVAATLWRLGESEEESKKRLETLLNNKTARGSAAKVLGEMGTNANSIVPTLLRASQERQGDDVWARALCAMAVLRIQGQSPEAIAVLEEAIAYSKSDWVRATVAEECMKLEKSALPMIPALRRALKDPDRDVRIQSSRALAVLEKLVASN